MLYYKLYQSNNSRVGTAGKWYARAAYVGTVDLDGLAEHMAAHNTPYSAGAIKGVLTDMVNCIKELILEGKQVKIPDLAIFEVGIRSTAADTPAKFNVQNCITSVHLKARGTGKLKNASVEDGVSLREWSKYDVTDTTSGN